MEKKTIDEVFCKVEDYDIDSFIYESYACIIPQTNSYKAKPYKKYFNASSNSNYGNDGKIIL